ncbi:hypothetical protein IF1G_08395 [Cordyceps javanica]|uniref:Uncharacterized protein n=1 Tax=Cordyceps javanica TaxID=43265 RepID=A0A545VTE0_9HYPO|nr:hypothetical protein IF1G_08395 [Cordyceps javanica]TQW04992.1 hypothetical protein IF2G_07635 [Cordyceps javanica]
MACFSISLPGQASEGEAVAKDWRVYTMWSPVTVMRSSKAATILFTSRPVGQSTSQTERSLSRQSFSVSLAGAVGAFRSTPPSASLQRRTGLK